MVQAVGLSQLLGWFRLCDRGLSQLLGWFRLCGQGSKSVAWVVQAVWPGV